MKTNKVILDLCGGTGSWSKSYKDNGYEVFNATLPEVDILRTTFENDYIHFHSQNGEQVEVFDPSNIYGILAAPPCTQFSDARTNAKIPRNLEQGMKIVNKCLEIIQYCQYFIKSDQSKISPLKFWCLENPWYGRLKWFIGYPIYIFDPWEFGDNYKKRTALWGYFNKPIKTVKVITEVMSEKEIEKGKTNSRKLPKFDMLLMSELKELKSRSQLDDWKQTKLRQTLRAITPQGFAKAFYEANK
jgi:hypothetical protein